VCLPDAGPYPGTLRTGCCLDAAGRGAVRRMPARCRR
jgi:hypothetical protein